MSEEEKTFGIIGIDPGSANGAIAIMECGMDFEVIRADSRSLPTRRKDGGTKRQKRLDEERVVEMIDEMVGDLFIKQVVIEHVSARPGQSAVGMWAFAEASGFLRGVVKARGYPVMKVVPRSWQKSMGLKTKVTVTSQRKANSRELAKTLCPDLNFNTAKDSDRAEALLMAEHGRMWLMRR